MSKLVNKIEPIEPDYQGFVEELWEREQLGFPIDTTLLYELAEKYNTPMPE